MNLARRAPILFLSALCLLLGAGLLGLSACNPRDYWTAAGAIGPFARSEPPDADDAVAAPPPVAGTFRPGEAVWWVNSFCVERGRSVLALVELRRADGRLVAQRGTLWTDQSRRCGPRWGSWALPADLEPGAYVLVGVAVARPGGLLPLPREIWRLPFTVAAPG